MKDKTQSIGFSAYILIMCSIGLILGILALKGKVEAGFGWKNYEIQSWIFRTAIPLAGIVYLPRDIITRLKMKELTANEVNWMEHPDEDELDENVWYRENESLSLWLILIPIAFHLCILVCSFVFLSLGVVCEPEHETMARALPYGMLLIAIVGIGFELWRLNRRKKALASVEKEND